MNRFFRTAYSTTLVYLCLAFLGVLVTGVNMPFLAFSCLYFGLLFFLLPGISRRLMERERLFYGLGILTAVLGFLPIALWRRPMLHGLIHLAGIAAAAVFLSILRHRTIHRLFLAKFEFSVVSLFAVIGLAYLFMRSDIFQGAQASARYEAVNLALNGAVPYMIVLLASGVLLLRGLRAQPGRMVDEQAFNRRQLRDTLIFAVLVTVVFAADPFSWLGKAISFLLNGVLRPSFRFLARLLASLFPSISFLKQTAEGPMPTEEPSDLRPVPEGEPAEVPAEPSYLEENGPTMTVDAIFLAAAVLILLIILALQIRKLAQNLRKRSRDRGSGYPNETCETLPKEEGTRERKPRKRNSDPRERIRCLYAEFLRCLHKRRVPLSKTNTCGEIRHGAEKRAVADPSTLSELTVLYEKARYQMKEAPAEADARVMKDLLDRIKKKQA